MNISRSSSLKVKKDKTKATRQNIRLPNGILAKTLDVFWFVTQSISAGAGIAIEEQRIMDEIRRMGAMPEKMPKEKVLRSNWLFDAPFYLGYWPARIAFWFVCAMREPWY